MKKFIRKYEVVYYDKSSEHIDLVYREFNDIKQALLFIKTLHLRNVNETYLRSYLDIEEE